jgi:hypothetical protein
LTLHAWASIVIQPQLYKLQVEGKSHYIPDGFVNALRSTAEGPPAPWPTEVLLPMNCISVHRLAGVKMDFETRAATRPETRHIAS